ncbi:MAG: thiol-disulfide oxidoreductase [Flavobacteriaceae bacterium]|nr:thiol-disulfide oxidoreductase [Flavobacteriaceae bacterium]
MEFLRKNWGNLLFIVIIGFLLIPQTSVPIKVFVQRLVSLSPSEVAENDREVITDYDWQLTNLEGAKINFEVSKGRVIVLNYWATWCPPCIAEMPSLQNLYDSYKDKNVDFYFVTSEDREVVERFLQKKGFSIPVYLQSYSAPQVLTSNVLPTTFLISKKGTIVMAETGAAKWDSKTVRETIDALLTN